MKLNEILEKLRTNKNNRIDYYENKQIITKKYNEVYEDLKVFSNFINSLGLQRGDRVGIIGDNSYSWILLDLACYVNGYISAPFHFGKHITNIDSIIEDFELKVTFVDDVYFDNIINNQGVYRLSDIPKLSKIDPPSIEHKEFGEEENFSIVFTSGTTAIPKAIELKVKTVDDFIQNISNMFEFKSDDKVIVFLPLSHFGQRSYVYGAILLGFDILLTSPEDVFLSLRKDKPTILIAVPFFFENLYKIFVKNKRKDALVKFLGGKMRILITGSAPISKRVVDFFEQEGIVLYEGYGTNETGLIALNNPKSYKSGSVGKVFPNKVIEIDQNGEVFVTSEFCWASAYLNMSEEQNKEVFLENGFIRTGDLGYFDKDGYLYINGRIKEMIVLSNGKKVIPTQVEDELNNSDLIAQSAVFGDNEQYISAVLVKEEETTQFLEMVDEIREINKKLPDFSHIKSISVIDEKFSVENYMLTSSLKLNRKHIYEVCKNEFKKIKFKQLC